MELLCASLSSVLVGDTQERRLSCGTGTIHTDIALSLSQRRDPGESQAVLSPGNTSRLLLYSVSTHPGEPPTAQLPCQTGLVLGLSANTD